MEAEIRISYQFHMPWNVLPFSFFPQLFGNIKSILSSQAVQIQVMGQICPLARVCWPLCCKPERLGWNASASSSKIRQSQDCFLSPCSRASSPPSGLTRTLPAPCWNSSSFFRSCLMSLLWLPDSALGVPSPHFHMVPGPGHPPSSH